MGLIRGSLMLGTGGLVSGSSKKQRVAKAQLRELQSQTKLLEQIADPGKLERERAARQAAKDARQARVAATLESRHQRALERKQRLAKVRKDTRAAQQQRAANRTPVPAWAVKTIRVIGWVWVVFFALGSIEATSKDGVAAIVVGILFAGIPAVVLWRTNLRTTEAAPASQAPTQ